MKKLALFLIFALIPVLVWAGKNYFIIYDPATHQCRSGGEDGPIIPCPEGMGWAEEEFCHNGNYAGQALRERHWQKPNFRAQPCGYKKIKDLQGECLYWVRVDLASKQAPYQIRIERIHEGDIFTIPDGWEYVEAVGCGHPKRVHIVLRRRVTE